jgi:hypothetical protein
MMLESLAAGAIEMIEDHPYISIAAFVAVLILTACSQGWQ